MGMKEKAVQKEEAEEKQKQSLKERKKCRVNEFFFPPLLTSGCPGTEAKCIVRVEKCQGPVDCGWGIPISEGLDCMKMPCICIPPENRFKYIWKMFIPNKSADILPNDSAIMEVCRDTHSVTFQCETQENGNITASVKHTVYETTGELIETLTVF
ncbi:sperm acrosome membrane-associated protein 1 [Theristicus caerulescens]